jgi:hypothetical protein
VATLKAELAARDEIIVALQHVIRDLRHEIENLRLEHLYAVFVCEAARSEPAEGHAPSNVHTLPLGKPDEAR